MSTEVYPPLPPDQLLKEEEASLVLPHFTLSTSANQQHLV